MMRLKFQVKNKHFLWNYISFHILIKQNINQLFGKLNQFVVSINFNEYFTLVSARYQYRYTPN